MNSMNFKKMGVTILAVLSTAVLSLFGCSSNSNDAVATMVSAFDAKNAGDLAAGLACEVELEVLADGTLYAVLIEPSEHGDHARKHGDHAGDCDSEEDDGTNEEEDGGTGEEKDHKDVDTGFSVQVDAVAADCSSFTVFSALTVVLGENEGDLQICDLTAGMWIEVEGEYGADGIFTADEIEVEDDAETEIESVIENLTDSTLTILGLTITYDANTVFATDNGKGKDKDKDGDKDGDKDEDTDE